MRISDWSSDVCSSDLNRKPEDASARDPAHPLLDDLRRGLYHPSQCPPECRHDADRSGDLRRARDHPAAIPESGARSEEHTSELQSLMRISYAVFCLKKKKKQKK